MRKKIWTVIFASALLILLSVVEQKAVRTLTDEAMTQTQKGFQYAAYFARIVPRFSAAEDVRCAVQAHDG